MSAERTADFFYQRVKQPYSCLLYTSQWNRGGRAQILKGQLDKEISDTQSSKVIKVNDIESYKLNVELPVNDG